MHLRAFLDTFDETNIHMTEKVAVETLTLNEISDLFRRSLEIARPRARGAIAHKMKKLEKAKVSNHKWIQTY